MLALDGKTVRGAHIPTATATGTGYPQPHLVSVLDQASGAVLGQISVQEKSNETGAFTTLLDDLDLTDVLITADAAHTNRNHADYLHGRGGHYLLTAKLNQPTLLRRLRALPWTQIGVATRERGRGHGRVETRSISVVSLHPIPDLGGEFFPHAAQAIKVVRRRPAQAGTKWTTVTVYAITSLTAQQVDPVLLARWLRGHWAIEALHWVRDVSFDEDRSQVRTSNGPQIMAALPRHHRAAPGRIHQHRRRATSPCPRAAPPARHLQDHLTTLPRPWEVDRHGVVSHTGSTVLRLIADNTGLTAGLSRASARRGFTPVHDRGRVIGDLAVCIADGGRVLSDLAALRDQPELYGPVASDPTAWRTLEAIGEPERQHIAAARARVRRRVWAQITQRHGQIPPSKVADVDLGKTVVIRMDATIQITHSTGTGTGSRSADVL